jgi:hypothetical protein
MNCVTAIREGRNIVALLNAVVEGTETLETIKPKIDAETEAGRERGGFEFQRHVKVSRILPQNIDSYL